MAKLTPNQQEFERQLRRIKRLMRESEKEGITFMRSPLPERPKRITKQRLELISRIKKQTVQEYPSFTTVNPEADITKLVKKHKKLEFSSPRKHGTNQEEYILIGRKGRKKGSKNKNPMPEERKEKLREQLDKARKKPRKKKSSTEKQKEARRKNLEKARQVKKEKIELEKAKQATVEPVAEPLFTVDEQTGELIEASKPRENITVEQFKIPELKPVDPTELRRIEQGEPVNYPKEDDVIINTMLQILESSEYDWYELGNLIINYVNEMIENYGEYEMVDRIKKANDDVISRVLNLVSYDFYKYEEARAETMTILEILTGFFGDENFYVPMDIVDNVNEIINKNKQVYHSSYNGWSDFINEK